MKKVLLIAILAILATDAPANITGTKHDFSSTGWAGSSLCQPCHTAHNAQEDAPKGVLWNHELTKSTFTVYSSSTLKTQVGQPDGTSKLCLSCHDGTVALDSYGGNAGSTFLSGKKVLGTNLSTSHPVSFLYNMGLAGAVRGLRDPMTTQSGLGKTIAEDLLRDSKMQCSSCHDPHGEKGYKNLMRKSTETALCLTCHNM